MRSLTPYHSCPSLHLTPLTHLSHSREGVVPAGTTRDQLVSAKVLYDSAYHPDTGEKMTVIGRMSFQVPGGMIIVGILMTFYQ